MSEQRKRTRANSPLKGSVATQAFVFLGGPLAWVAQLVLSYAIIAVGCDVWSSTLVHVLLYLTSIAAGAVAVAGVVVAFRAARRTRGPLDTFMEGPEDRSGFFAVIGLLTSALFVGVILSSALAVVLMSPCS